jgi:hypothetical protein
MSATIFQVLKCSLIAISQRRCVVGMSLLMTAATGPGAYPDRTTSLKPLHHYSIVWPATTKQAA